MFVLKNGEFARGWLKVRFRKDTTSVESRRVIVTVAKGGFSFIADENAYLVPVKEGSEIDAAVDLYRSHGNVIESIGHVSNALFAKYRK